MEELCPDAWLFNYCNPLSANVRAVHKTSTVRCVGLCHGILGTRHTVGLHLGLPASHLQVMAAGVNHLCWLLSIRQGEDDLYPAFRAKVRQEQEARRTGPPLVGADPYEGPQQVSAQLMDIYGLYPSPGDRHVAEFFPWFLQRQGDHLGHGLQSGLDMTNDIIAGKGTLWDRLRAEAEGTTPLNHQLFEETREGERVVSIMESILFDVPSRELAVNVANNGLMPGPPDWAVVEVPGKIDGRGVRGTAPGPLPAAVEDILRQRVYQQELTVEAALSGDRTLALQALLADPLVPTVESAEGMLTEALQAHASYLPQFSRVQA
jgi:alpha-galactosidase